MPVALRSAEGKVLEYGVRKRHATRHRPLGAPATTHRSSRHGSGQGESLGEV